MSLHWESFVFAIIAFGILYFLLNRYAFGPLFGVMEKRRQHIQEQLEQAANDRTQSEQLLKEQRQALEAARREAYEMIEQAKKTSAKQAEEIIESARAEAARLREEALRDIENEKNKAVAELRGQVAELSVQIASRIMEKQMDAQTQSELVDKYLQEVGIRQ
jgi:F-type H+-transporting ATPase subunit b